MGNFIKEDIEAVWGFVEDAIHLGRNRSLAEDVRVLVSVVVQKQKAAELPVATLSESLENTKKLLQRAVEPPAEAVKPLTFHVEWGRETEVEGPAQPDCTAVSAAEADAEPAPSTTVSNAGAEQADGVDSRIAQAELIVLEKTIVEEARSSLREEAIEREKGRNAAMVTAAIELCDWLDRVRENEGIAPERVGAVTKQKSGALLAALGVERIEEGGTFDQQYQQVVDSVATDSAEKNMQVCETVQCGYRSKVRIIRPQLVMVYLFKAGKSAAGQN